MHHTPAMGSQGAGDFRLNVKNESDLQPLSQIILLTAVS